MLKLERFVFDSVPPELARLLEAATMPSLTAGPKNDDLRDWLQNHGANLPELQPLAKSALWLVSGDLDASHEISQSVATADGSFWHGIMHRREGDFWNAKYWFRRVGRHPVLTKLAKTDYRDPQSFVDRCEAAPAFGDTELEACKTIQWLEWQLLFKHCLDSE